jgi:ABC-type polysaccharide/polyol phosphate transport system ATPase subunit
MVSGSTLGIIGKNGAGKSTLLKIISGIIKPTSGSVKVKGSLVPLLELGTGFHPELTGRENIIISGLILGLSKKEIYKKIDEIIEFAELKDVIDEPVRTYSSGMYSRLAFSTAFSIDPDIIILDEILSVGDIAFASKSKEKVKEFKRKNKTILFVSHDMKSVKEMCDEAIYIDKGRLIQRGEVDTVVSLCGV